MKKILLAVLILSLAAGAAFYIYYAVQSRKVPTSREAVAFVTTVAGAGTPGAEDGPAGSASFNDPFGIAVDRRGNIIVADGGESNRIRRITPQGNVETLAGSQEGFADGPSGAALFNTPSAVALDGDGNIIIADTSNNSIRKLSIDGLVTTIAGTGEPGYTDGSAEEARFDGPVGVAVDGEGNIFVADSYNDRIRRISAGGLVSTVAGTGLPGLRDGPASEALFDTPCGLAVDEAGNIFVADTGNDAVRQITPQGVVITILPDAQSQAEEGSENALNRPVGITVTHDGFLFVTSEGGGELHRISPEREIARFAGRAPGFADGPGDRARFNGPTGIAIDREGNLYVADTQNYLIRRVAPVSPKSTDLQAAQEPQKVIQPALEDGHERLEAIIPKLSRSTLALKQSFPWPLSPQDRWHELTGVVGEARGAPGGIALHHLHSGLDVRGNMGEPVLSIIDEKVSSPVPNWNFGGANEGIRLGLMSYIHIRVGRDDKDEIRSRDRFKPRLDESGNLAGVRVRRGARFRVGEFIGTLNRLYHVHLNFGPWNAQANPIEFPFAALKDTIAPTIEPGGIEVVDSLGQPFKQKRTGRVVISGDVDVMVTAYDRVDGNTAGRKLGLYKAGYQLLGEDGAPAKGFEVPLTNIEFNRLPPGDESVFIVYGAGSGVSAYGTPTKFKYIVTNLIRDGRASDGVLRTSEVAPGNYILKVIASDYAGNIATGALPVTIEQP